MAIGDRTDPATIERFVQLVAGARCESVNEAARAVGISEGLKDRLMRRPDIRQRVEEAGRAEHARTIPDEAREQVDALLAATDKDGDEDWTARARGVEMLMRYQGAFEASAEDVSEALPEGVYLVFPRVPS